MRDETLDIYARIHNRIDEILYYVWDPIGVAGVAAARDEYDGYVPTVVDMLLKGAASESIARYLREVASEAMGLSVGFDDKHSIRISEMLLAHYHWLSREK